MQQVNQKGPVSLLTPRISADVRRCLQKDNIVFTRIIPIIIFTICFSLFNNQLVAQEPLHGANGKFTITGTVRDFQTNRPLTGASLKLGELTTKTDKEGKFSLRGPFSTNRLSISHLGYNDTIFTITSPNKTLEIVLNPKDNQIEEVEVVSTGYQKIPKERATGSFTYVDSKTLQRNTGMALLSRLNGVANGLLIDRNTGNSDGISVRGRSTIFSSTRPLIVVDNFPYEGNLENINPNDIESVTVLKDATAASIWGVRSANGVIVVTTKKAKDHFRAEFSSTFSTASKPDLFYQPQMSSKDFIEVEKYLFQQGYYDKTINTRYEDISAVVEVLDQVRTGKLSAEQADRKLSEYGKIDSREDYGKYFFRNKLESQQYVGISSASSQFRNVIGIGYDKSLGERVSVDQQRFNLRTSTQWTGLNDRVNVDLNIWYTGNRHNNGNAAGYTPRYPYDRFIGKDGQPVEASGAGSLRRSYTDTVANGLLLDWKYRPLEELNNRWNNFTSNDQQLRYDLGLAGRLYRSISLKLNFLSSRNWTDNIQHYDKNSFFVRDRVNQFTGIDPATGILSRPLPYGDILDRNTTKLDSRYARAQLEWNETFGEDHRLSGLLGTEWRQDRLLFDSPGYLYGYNPDLENFQEVDIFSYFPIYHNADYSKIQRYASRRRQVDNNRSWFGLLSYTYRDNLTLTGSIRKDASNIFGVAANQKGVPLWSVGSSYSFHHLIPWEPIDRLKLRMTYGYNGNVDKNTTAYLTSRLYQNMNLWGSPSDVIINPPNSTLRWERVSNTNLGVDFQIFKGLMGGSFEYFIKKGKDLMGNSPIAPQTGISEFYGNVASTTTRGIDLQLWIEWMRRKELTLRTDLILNIVKDRVDDYYKQPSTNTDIVTAFDIVPLVGAPINALTLYRSSGLNSQGDPLGYLQGKPSSDYGAILNGFDRESIQIVGSRVPTHFGSLRNTMAYKGFELSFQILYKFGNFLRKTNSLNSTQLIAGNYRFDDYPDRWKKQGDEQFTNVPKFIYPLDINREEFYQRSTTLAYSASLVRLQDVRFSYTMQPFSRQRTSSLQFFLFADNLGIIWKSNDMNLDPEVLSGYPSPLGLSLGIKFNY